MWYRHSLYSMNLREDPIGVLVEQHKSHLHQRPVPFLEHLPGDQAALPKGIPERTAGEGWKGDGLILVSSYDGDLCSSGLTATWKKNGLQEICLGCYHVLCQSL